MVYKRIIKLQNSEVETWSEGIGPAVILIPSLGRGAEDFDVIAPSLVEAGFKVYCLQPRGIGRSRGSLIKTTMLDWAGDIASVIKVEKIGPAILAGHGFGSIVARVFATYWPELISGVAILAGTPGRAPAGQVVLDQDVQEATRASADMSLAPSVRLECLKKGFFAPGNNAEVWLDGWFTEVSIAQYEAFLSMPMEKYFETGNVPILEIQAQCDAVAPKRVSHVLKEALGDRVTVVVIANAGHALLPEQPKAVSAALIPWLRKVSSS